MKEENKVAHMNMVQQIITRMGNNSFMLKGWTIGIMVAVFAFAGKDAHKAIMITIIPLGVIWFLDSYYLTIERKYRALYEEIRLKKESEITFDMNFNNVKLTMNNIKKYSIFNSFTSISVMPFYLVCIVTTLLLYLIKI